MSYEVRGVTLTDASYAFIQGLVIIVFEGHIKKIFFFLSFYVFFDVESESEVRFGRSALAPSFLRYINNVLDRYFKLVHTIRNWLTRGVRPKWTSGSDSTSKNSYIE